MSEGMSEDLERQLARLLEEAERPMSVEEIFPHVHPVTPSLNDIADSLARLATEGTVEREGSYFFRSTPVPIDKLFATAPQRETARAIVEIIRELDAKTGEGARLPAVLRVAKIKGFDVDRVLDVMAVLRNAGEAYSVGGDRMRLAKP